MNVVFSPFALFFSNCCISVNPNLPIVSEDGIFFTQAIFFLEVTHDGVATLSPPIA